MDKLQSRMYPYVIVEKKILINKNSIKKHNKYLHYWVTCRS